ncbi:Copia protease [Ceratocystis lukuohia]|uniref:Copia protease n=1 Tax=Ceratocystis lukuohia TaxID=2019550 RepID=A0ABR4M9I3_9PEZI
MQQLTRTMHNRCGHISNASLVKTVSNTRGSLVQKPKFTASWACDTCLKAKAVHFSPQDSRPPVHAVMDCIHIDVANVGWSSTNDCKYFVVLTDEFTRFRIAAAIPKTTKKAGDIIIDKLKAWSNQTGRKPVKLMLDNGTDVNIQKIKNWASQNGISVVTSPPHMPAQNGVAERSVKEILTKLRIAVADGVPEDCWDLSLSTIVEKINTVVPQDQETSATQKWDSEIARLAGRHPPPSPGIAHWRTLGSKCYITLPESEVANLHLSKITPRAIEGVLIGHEGSHNYIVYSKTNGKIYRTPHVRIIEEIPRAEPTLVSRPLGTLRPTKKDIQANLSNASTGQKNIIYSEVQKNHDTTNDDAIDEIQDGYPHGTDTAKDTLFVLSSFSDPSTPKQALAMSDKWRDAMDKEIETMLSYNVFEFTDRPIDKKLIRLRWVFRIKTDGRYKARLVARGDMQREGFDYGQTFASTSHSDSWRILMATAVMKGRVLRQFDIKAAYLHGIIQEDVYVSVPKELEDYFQRNPHISEHLGYKTGMVIKLKRTLYGLKQSGHEWQKVMKQYLLHMGFKQVPCDPAAYRNENLDITVCTHIDDLLYDGPNEEAVKSFERKLMDRFHGELTEIPKWLLGVTLGFNPNSVELDQIILIDSILEEAGMNECQPSQTPAPLPPSNPWQDRPIDPHDVELDKESADRFRRLVGRLMYVRVMTRPDISPALSRLVSAFNKPRTSHDGMLTHLLRYMNTTKSLKITYTAPQKHVTGPIKAYMYSDSTWVDDPDARSTTGFVIYLAGGPVIWVSRRQNVVARSTLEAELIAMSDAMAAAMFMKSFATQTGHDIEITGFADNKGSLTTANRTDATSRATRHIRADHFYIREKVADGSVALEFVDTKHQIADALTKPLSAPLTKKYNKVLFGGLDPDKAPHESIVIE